MACAPPLPFRRTAFRETLARPTVSPGIRLMIGWAFVQQNTGTHRKPDVRSNGGTSSLALTPYLITAIKRRL